MGRLKWALLAVVMCSSCIFGAGAGENVGTGEDDVGMVEDVGADAGMEVTADSGTDEDAGGESDAGGGMDGGVEMDGAVDECPEDPDKTDPGVCGCGVADVDTDEDGTLDCEDECPDDMAKTMPGICGCGVAETDSDGDGTLDCEDECPDDMAKTVPGMCGCGESEMDMDGDGVADCVDMCAGDMNKTEPGACGCGTPDDDTDGDGTLDCDESCPNDPSKTEAGVCGCGTPDDDTDNDGTLDCNDECPMDSEKQMQGVCGCGTPDVDSDGDGTLDCNDGCPMNSPKTDPGACGCGVADTDTDNDGTPDCNDDCPSDMDKTNPGTCGCGTPDVDTDGNGILDCEETCPNDPNKDTAGVCGCGVPDVDTDGDGTLDCNDNCPDDANKTEPLTCGCGVSDDDRDGDGTPDCNDLCPSDASKTAPGTCGCGVSDGDSDGDGYIDCLDNCPLTTNADQRDDDLDGIGDVCDTCHDVDGDGYGTSEGANTSTCVSTTLDCNPADDRHWDDCSVCDDADDDGYGDNCDLGTDCDDANAFEWNNCGSCRADNDNDGNPAGCGDAPDCDDNDMGRHHRMTDVPLDGIDNDCDGQDATLNDADYVYVARLCTASAVPPSDQNPGTQDAPLATFLAGVERARATGRQIVITNATYQPSLANNQVWENEPITESVFGGFNCDQGWVPSNSRTVLDLQSGALFPAYDDDPSDDADEGRPLIVFADVDVESFDNALRMAPLETAQNPWWAADVVGLRASFESTGAQAVFADAGSTNYLSGMVGEPRLYLVSASATSGRYAQIPESERATLHSTNQLFTQNATVTNTGTSDIQWTAARCAEGTCVITSSTISGGGVGLELGVLGFVSNSAVSAGRQIDVASSDFVSVGIAATGGGVTLDSVQVTTESNSAVDRSLGVSIVDGSILDSTISSSGAALRSAGVVCVNDSPNSSSVLTIQDSTVRGGPAGAGVSYGVAIDGSCDTFIDGSDVRGGDAFETSTGLFVSPVSGTWAADDPTVMLFASEFHGGGGKYTHGVYQRDGYLFAQNNEFRAGGASVESIGYRCDNGVPFSIDFVLNYTTTCTLVNNVVMGGQGQVSTGIDGRDPTPLTIVDGREGTVNAVNNNILAGFNATAERYGVREGVDGDLIHNNIFFNGNLSNLAAWCRVEDKSGTCAKTNAEVNALRTSSYGNIGTGPGIQGTWGDWHLTSGSAMIDAAIDPIGLGYTDAVREDVDGDARPQGNAWDIGFDEFIQ